METKNSESYHERAIPAEEDTAGGGAKGAKRVQHSESLDKFVSPGRGEGNDRLPKRSSSVFQ